MARLTIAEKILSQKSGRDARAGMFVTARVDVVMAHDGNRPIAIDTLRELGFERPAHPDRVVLVLDHAVPPPTQVVANIHGRMRAFAATWGTHLTEIGHGIGHLVLPEGGHVRPGDLVVASDSHTTTIGAVNCLATGVGSSDLALALARGELWFRVPSTLRVVLEGALAEGVYPKDIAQYLIRRLGLHRCNYRSLEFEGSAVETMSMDGRFTLANVAVELGAKCAIFPHDGTLRAWLRDRVGGEPVGVAADPDAEYEETYQFDLTGLRPQVARPHSPADVVDVDEVAGTPVHSVFIGTCSAGRFEDLEAAARVLRGRSIARGVRLIVVPGSAEVFRRAVRQGIAETLLAAGATLVTPGCGPCAGVSQGVPGDDETVVATSPRNFRGRMGNPKAQIFLASPATAAASAVAGAITDPRRFLS
ncbi:MAG: aconitase/3-isopropylmalate dehydratase large subunit family protein [Armatimonadota bacterium]|nr:aconitase/3-isopropylmalate dehydratase large subunit family protein [Armatimonadota bacterium]